MKHAYLNIKKAVNGEVKLMKRPIAAKLLGLLAISMVMLLSLVMAVNAAAQLTLNTVTWQDGTVVNISTKSANDGSLVNITFIDITFSAVNTANTTTTRVINITNTTATNFDFGYANFTFSNDLQYEDTSRGSVTGLTTGIGASDAVALAATAVTIDRTAPNVPTSLSPTGIQTVKDLTFSATVGNGTTTTLCNLVFIGRSPASSSTIAMTHSGSTCSKSLTNIQNAQYEYRIDASDGTNITGEPTATVLVDVPGGSIIKSLAIQQQNQLIQNQQAGATGTSGNRTLGLLVVVGIIIWFAKNMKGKRKK